MDGGGPGVAPLGRQLINAAKQGTIERVGALLDQGVLVDSRDGHLNTPLMWTSIQGHRAVAYLLLDREADVNAESNNGETSAILASIGGHLDILQLLVSRGADIHHKSNNGASCLLLAALWDRLPVCEYLLSLGADLMAASNHNKTVLSQYGYRARPPLSPETKALRVAALEAWWAAGPHPSQVQRRRDERWARRGPLITVLAEHAYRPLQLRAFALDNRRLAEEVIMLRRYVGALTQAAAAGAALPAMPNVLVQYNPKAAVFRTEGLVRCIVAFL